jgi:hypothetical protein
MSETANRLGPPDAGVSDHAEAPVVGDRSTFQAGLDAIRSSASSSVSGEKPGTSPSIGPCSSEGGRQLRASSGSPRGLDRWLA